MEWRRYTTMDWVGKLPARGHLMFCALVGILLSASLGSAQVVSSGPISDGRLVAFQGAQSQVQNNVNNSAEKNGPENQDEELDFLEKDIRELARTRVTAPAMETELTSVSKQVSTIGHSAAAVFVITSEIAVVGQNLFDSHHYEFQSEVFGLGATEVRRAVYGQLSWRY